MTSGTTSPKAGQSRPGHEAGEGPGGPISGLSEPAKPAWHLCRRGAFAPDLPPITMCAPLGPEDPKNSSVRKARIRQNATITKPGAAGASRMPHPTSPWTLHRPLGVFALPWSIHRVRSRDTHTPPVDGKVLTPAIFAFRASPQTFGAKNAPAGAFFARIWLYQTRS